MNKKLLRTILLTLSIIFSLFYSSNVQAADNEEYNVIHVDSATLAANQKNKIEKVDEVTVEDCIKYTFVYEKDPNYTGKLPNTGIDNNIKVGLAVVGLLGLAFVAKRKNTRILIVLLAAGTVLSLPLAKISASEDNALKNEHVAIGELAKPLAKKGYKFIGVIKDKKSCELVPENPIPPKEVETKIPNDPPKEEKEALKTTRHLIEGTGVEFAEPELGFTEPKSGVIKKDEVEYQYSTKTDQTEDLCTHWYKAIPKKNKDARVRVWLEIYHAQSGGVARKVWEVEVPKDEIESTYPVYKEENGNLVNVDYNFKEKELRAWGREHIKGSSSLSYNLLFRDYDYVIPYRGIIIEDNELLKDIKGLVYSDPFQGKFEEGKDVHLRLIYYGFPGPQ